MTDTDLFRILVVEDEPEPVVEVERQFSNDPRIEVLVANTQALAESVLDERHVDAAIIDIDLDKPDAGFEVLREMTLRAPNAAAVIVTQHTDKPLRHAVGLQAPRVVGILEKYRFDEGWAVSALRESICHWSDRAVAITGVDMLAGLLNHRARRGRIPQLRGLPEIKVELDRLFRTLFGDVTGIGQPVRVVLGPIARQGLSAAVTVTAAVHIGHDVHEDDLPGAVVVLKVGPVADIRTEVERYEAFVKYGVRLSHRVELLGHGFEQSLGAITYSFAGGVFGVSLVSLDDVLHGPLRERLERDVFDQLFSTDSRNWYRVELEPMAPLSYFNREARLDLAFSYKRLADKLTHLDNRLKHALVFSPPTQRAGRLDVSGVTIQVPPSRIWGSGPFLASAPTSLVHGDMHGGNVMVELDTVQKDGADLGVRRVCLIDYANAGRGPRLLDFVALEASVRLADARQIIQDIAQDRGALLSDEELLAGVKRAALRAEQERRLIRVLWGDEVLQSATPWELSVLRLIEMARWNFSAITQREHDALAALYVIRQMAYSLDPISRVRLLAWLDAMIGTIE
jgi:CheY-like chemotaxis protein